MTSAKPSEAWSLCELGVERGYLSAPEAQELRGTVERLSSADVAADWLVRAGLLTQAEAGDLRATWKTISDASTEEAGGGAPAADLHPRTAAQAAGGAGAPRLPQIPGFEVVSEVGRGGMGVVYKARQVNPPRSVALKVMLHGVYASERSRHRFAREVAAAAKLHHPGVVPVFEAGEHDGVPYYTMEFVQGTTLHHYLESHAPSLQEKLRLFSQICAVVEHAHQQGLVHRDLKPSNTMIEDEGRVRVLDFGLAKFLVPREGGLQSQLTQAGALVGTCLYMSPEQARGETDQVDEQSDVYSLGVILYEMLAGGLPYPEDLTDQYQLLLHITREEPRRPSTVDRSLRGDLETIILTCLDKDKARRYRNAGELRNDVERFLRIEPIRARPASVATKALRFVQRNRVAVVCGALAVVAAALTGLLMYGLPVLSSLRKINSPHASVREEGWKELRSTDIGLRQALKVLQTSLDDHRRLEAVDFIDASRPEMRPAQVLQVLAEILDDESQPVRERGAALFSERAPADQTVQRLVEPLDAEVRRLLIIGLAGSDVSDVTGVLKGLLLDSDARIERAAGEGLRQRVRDGRVAAAEVVEWMADPEQAVREFAVQTAAAFGAEPQVRQALLARVQRRDEDGVVRRGAAESLVKVHAKIDWQVLTRLLTEEDEPAVAAHLATLIGQSGHPEAGAVLCRSLDRVLSDPLMGLWIECAVELTRQIGVQGAATDEAKNVLLRALAAADTSLKRVAIDAIASTNIDPADAEDWAMPLTRYLLDGDLSLRTAAIAALERLAAPESVPEVLRAFRSTQEAYAAERLERALEELHGRLVDTHPEAAQQIRAWLWDRHRQGHAVYHSRRLPFVALYPADSTTELLECFPAFNDPQHLRELGGSLDDESETIRAGAARWLAILTAGRVDPATMPEEKVRELLRAQWRWERGAFVLEHGAP